MKNYDLSKYILQKDNLMLFPLTKEEVQILKLGVEQFSSYIKIPYLAKKHEDDFLDMVLNGVDMENDYWFLDSLWVCTDIKAKAIVGTLKLEKIDQFNKIVLQVSDKHCKAVTREDVTKLFYRFLAGNNYVNIVIQDLDGAEHENK